jgi:hypothetical protein
MYRKEKGDRDQVRDRTKREMGVRVCVCAETRK